MKQKFVLSACAIAAWTAAGGAYAQEATSAGANASAGANTTDTIVVTGKRANRVSKGATGLAMDIKDTPQTISTIDKEDIADFGATGSNDALRLGTGINIEQYETNRATFNSRGFEIQLTQLDGVGMTNSWGTVVGQQDSYLFDKIELIRGANGLLTGVGNSSGTINYVRKRPTNQDGGEFGFSAGSYNKLRGTLDYNKVLTDDGSWAGRLIVTSEDKDSYLRALHDQRNTVYGVIDGQIGSNGVLTLGITSQDAKQKSPMWGSLTLNYADGSLADFPVSSSTSQDWTMWNTNVLSGFAEYAYTLNKDWEAKLTYNHSRTSQETKLLYAYTYSGYLNADNTGLVGWPYHSFDHTENDLLDANVSGQFQAFGRSHSLIAGASYSRQRTGADLAAAPASSFLSLPAFPYAGDVYPEPQWGPRKPDTTGSQALTRVYLATRLAVTDQLKAILGLNGVHLQRQGSSVYGNTAAALSPDLSKLSPYAGLTYDITPDVLAYVSYSDIFQNQDQMDINSQYLAPVKGVNYEAGVKAEWLGKKLLTTFAVFSSRQQGLATYVGINPANSQYYYAPKDVNSKGFEMEATGRIGADSKITAGLTHLAVDGPDGHSIYEWIPRTTANLRFDTRLAALKLGADARWQSDVSKDGGAYQKAYLLANAFAAYDLTDKATIRFNVNNLFDKKYVGTVAYGAIYGAPRNFALSFNYKI